MKKFLFSLIACGVSACTSMATPTALPTASPTPTSTPTPTVEWFPPTETPMPAPSQVFTPVPELSDLGEVIFRDDFDRPGNWRLEDTNRGCVNISNNEINLIIRESGTFLYSVLEEPKFTDFYVEITASPSLCAGKDEYGLMFRADRKSVV